MATSIASLQRLIAEARSAEVWRELGFASWTAYVADVTSAQPVRLEREQRRELVAMLTAEGMTPKAISSTLGVDRSTVSRDRSQGVQAAHPDVPRATSLTGLDGKTYAPPKPYRHLAAVPERIDPTTGEVLNPAPSVEAFLSADPEISRLRAQQKVAKAMRRIGELTVYEADWAAGVLDDEDLEILDNHVRRLTTWAAAVHNARKPGLRAIDGSTR